MSAIMCVAAIGAIAGGCIWRLALKRFVFKPDVHSWLPVVALALLGLGCFFVGLEKWFALLLILPLLGASLLVGMALRQAQVRSTSCSGNASLGPLFGADPRSG